MASEQIIERTDFSEPRLTAATRSLCAWRETELFRLKRERELFTEELEKTTDDEQRLELQRAILQNEREKIEFEKRWQNSSLRRKLTPNQQTATVNDIEKRLLTSSVRSSSLVQREPRAAKGQQIKLTGYAAVFNRNSLDVGGFVERIEPGAFTSALQTSDVRALVNHDANLLLGRTSSKTLRLYQDRVGLQFYVDVLPDDGIFDSIVRRIQRRDITGGSFAFTVKRDRWELARRPGELDLRVIVEIEKLFDVSPAVVFPAYPDTSVGVLVEPRSVADAEGITETAGPASRFDVADDYDDIWEGVLRKSAAKRKLTEFDYRRAGKIISRCRAAISARV